MTRAVALLLMLGLLLANCGIDHAMDRPTGQTRQQIAHPTGEDDPAMLADRRKRSGVPESGKPPPPEQSQSTPSGRAEDVAKDSEVNVNLTPPPNTAPLPFIYSGNPYWPDPHYTDPWDFSAPGAKPETPSPATPPSVASLSATPAPGSSQPDSDKLPVDTPAMTLDGKNGERLEVQVVKPKIADLPKTSKPSWNPFPTLPPTIRADPPHELIFVPPFFWRLRIGGSDTPPPAR